MEKRKYTPANTSHPAKPMKDFMRTFAFLLLAWCGVNTAIAQSDLVAFRVVAVHEDGRQSISNEKTVNRPLRIYVPTAFTPDGDGLNDVFTVKGEGIAEFRIFIYDRWGKKVFESAAVLEGWNGKINGADAPGGVYAYELVAFGEEIGSVTKSGTLTLAYR